MSDTKFSYLQLAQPSSQDTDKEVSLQSLIESSDALAEEAKEVLPYSFDECTYQNGYLRQAIWACVDCGEKGVCYGCSISCHAGQSLIPLSVRTVADGKNID
jgi:E3 ubiquitin-protein ligase UBR7